MLHINAMANNTTSLVNRLKAVITIVLMLSSTVACGSSTRLEGATQKAQAPSTLVTTSPCERIVDIKTLPFKDEAVDDDAFNALFSEGDRAIPCLIEKITDTTVMKDPRQAPKVLGVRVGDVAYFVLVRLARIDFVELLPADVRKAYSEEGVYGYFERIDEDNNRQKLQEAASKWYEKKFGRELRK